MAIEDMHLKAFQLSVYEQYTRLLETTITPFSSYKATYKIHSVLEQGTISITDRKQDTK